MEKPTPSCVEQAAATGREQRLAGLQGQALRRAFFSEQARISLAIPILCVFGFVFCVVNASVPVGALFDIIFNVIWACFLPGDCQ